MALKRENLGVRITSYVVLGIAALFAVLPFLMLLSSSLTSQAAIAAYGYGFFPVEFSFDAYSYLLTAWDLIGRAYLVTIVVTVVGTVLHIIVTTLFAYGLAWKKTPFKGLIMVLLILTLLFNGGAVSSYIIWSVVFKVKNTIWALIFPNMLMGAIGVILFMNYFKNSVSPELMEATQIDGANMFRIYWSIYMPLSLPLIATLGLSCAIGYWNDWNNSLYYIEPAAQKLYSVQRLLREMQASIDFIASNPQYDFSDIEIPDSSVQMAIAVIGIIPIVVAYPFFQKWFIAGIGAGAVKG